MAYLTAGLIVVWFGGLLFLAGLCMNDIRLVLNNVTPGKRASANFLRPHPAHVMAAILVPALDLVLATALLLFGRSSRMKRFNKGFVGAVDPDSLNETGRANLQRTIRHERIMLAWMIGGFILIVWWFS